MKKKNKAVFIDRDGTLIKDKNYLSDHKRIEFYTDAYRAIRLLRAGGYRVIMTTNQSGIGRGYFTLKTLKQIHARLQKKLTKHKVKIDRIYFCPHLPEKKCRCRKPRIGMPRQAQKDFNLDLEKSFVIGDKRADIRMAYNFGGKGILVLTGKGKEELKKFKNIRPHHVSQSIYHAAKWILQR